MRLTDALKAKIQAEAVNYEPLDDDFNPMDRYGGNFDDAFHAGVQHGREELAKELESLIQ
jgi:hypothetical protein